MVIEESYKNSGDIVKMVFRVTFTDLNAYIRKLKHQKQLSKLQT